MILDVLIRSLRGVVGGVVLLSILPRARVVRLVTRIV
jgi:hypothetical protein